MGKRKIQEKDKHKIKTISLPSDQIKFLENHITFDLSKFVQIHLREYIYLTRKMERIRKEVVENEKVDRKRTNLK